MSGTENLARYDPTHQARPARDSGVVRLPTCMVRESYFAACLIATVPWLSLLSATFMLPGHPPFRKGHATIQPFLPREPIHSFPFVVFSSLF